MVDLEKERIAFEEWVRDVAPQIQWELHAKDEDGNYEYVSMSWAFSTWEHKQAEINDLKQKLARYENPDYVLVPRKPTPKIMNAFLGRSFNVGYKAMIEEAEKQNY